MFPSFIEGIYQMAKAAGLPPRGSRAFSITGAVTLNYLSALHEEPLGDPLWTLGIVLWRSLSLRHSPDFGFAFPGLHGGRGLIIRPSKSYLWFWKGGVNVHGGLLSKHTAEAVKNKMGAHQHITAAMYLKERPLNYGHRYLQGPPKDLKMYTRRLDMQNQKFGLGWQGR